MLIYAIVLNLFIIHIQADSVNSNTDYLNVRNKFLNDEKNSYLGSKLILNKKESDVNNVLIKYKNEELNYGFKHPDKFIPAIHFFNGKKLMNDSKVFKILKKIPKGTALHIHDSDILSADWLLKNVTYRDNLYMCGINETVSFIFSDKQETDGCKLLKNIRENSLNVEYFDELLKSQLSMEVDNPEKVYTDITVTWKIFQGLFEYINPLINYRPVFEDYYYETLQSFYDDNVLYIELRSNLPRVYELDGTTITPEEVVRILKKISDRFIKDHPDSMGMRFIYAPQRLVDNETVETYLKLFRKLQLLYPDFVVGFDLVGQEDLGRPLVDFVSELSSYKNNTNFFFHAGETNWNGMSSDNNLIDAVLLNTTRIGHGFAVVKHPKVMKEIKKRGIAIEMNPISNQVLMLVKDLRNHPGSILMAEDYPVVISSDGPGFYGAEGLTHDFYMAFMGIAHHDADLKFLKQLALNSINYSGLSSDDKRKLLDLWQKKWNVFLDNVLDNVIEL